MPKFKRLLSDEQREFLEEYTAKRDRSKGYMVRGVIYDKIENLEENGVGRSESGN